MFEKVGASGWSREYLEARMPLAEARLLAMDDDSSREGG